MKSFDQINIGDVFTLQRKLKNNPQTLWRKQSSRTAALCLSGVWFYFSKSETVYPAKDENLIETYGDS